ncbi:MAG: hypothetical protein ABSA06_15265 [Geobacteraceae bacterium]
MSIITKLARIFSRGPQEQRDMSCRICGFFVPRETENGNAGYCLYFDDVQKLGESLKIPLGAGKESANSCRHYFRRVPTMTQVEFLQWRVSAEIVGGQRKIKSLLNFIAILGFFVGTAGLVLTALKGFK